MEFRLDGTLLNTEHDAPWSCSWYTSSAAPGSNHQLTAKAFDSMGRTGEASIEVTVAGGTGVTGGKRSFYVDSTRTTNGDGSEPGPA